MSDHQSPDTRTLHEAVIKHVTLYQVTVPQVVCRLFYPDAQFSNRGDAMQKAGNTLSGLVRAGKLASHSLPNGPHKYYTLPGESPSGNDVGYDLATLWFCCLGKKRYHRLDFRTETKLLFPVPPPHQNRHVIGEESGGPVIYRIYTPRCSPSQVIQNLRRQIRDARNKRELSDWIDHGDYGIAVLAETEPSHKRLRSELTRPRQGQRPLTDQIRIQVALGPSAETYSDALKSINSRQNRKATDGASSRTKTA